jgi:hypothetical protein
MSDTREILRRGLGGYTPPADGYERVLVRRDRRRRNQRVMAGAVAAAIIVATVLLLSKAFTDVESRVPGDPSREPTPSPSQAQPVSNEVIVSGMWPQATAKEAAEAQRQADAGDADVLWQMRLNPADGGPGDTDVELVERFLEQELGWTDFRLVGGVLSEGVWTVVFVRCEEGAVNPLYPTDELGGRCAPTFSDTRYETVEFELEQPVTEGRGGIWVITSAIRFAQDDRAPQQGMWLGQEFEQAVPPTPTEIENAVQAFIDARVAGRGAERFLYLDAGHEEEDLAGIPELYETRDGIPYERGELVRIDSGPAWPTAWSSVTLRLYPEGSGTVVTQSWLLRPVDIIRPEGGELLFDYR